MWAVPVGYAVERCGNWLPQSVSSLHFACKLRVYTTQAMFIFPSSPASAHPVVPTFLCHISIETFPVVPLPKRVSNLGGGGDLDQKPKIIRFNLKFNRIVTQTPEPWRIVFVTDLTLHILTVQWCKISSDRKYMQLIISLNNLSPIRACKEDR